jgi:FMN phosphatase YigB (HAD superfamily)
MKTFLLPHRPLALVFDIDNTLYHDEGYLREQTDSQVLKFGRFRRISPEEAREVVDAARTEIFSRTGTRPSLAHTLKALGIPIETSIAWRKEAMQPERYLSFDERLGEMLSRLVGSYRLMALTNNPREIGLRTLRCLGVERFFEDVTGLDSTGESKPSWGPFRHALETMNLEVSMIAMVGDRYDVDLAPVIERGGAGILVESRRDLLGVPGVLKDAYGLSSRH